MILRAIPLAVVAALGTDGAIMAMREAPAKARPAAPVPVGTTRADLAVQAVLTERRGPFVMRWCTSAAREVCR